VLNPYPEPQLKGYVSSHNSRNTSKPTFETSSKSCRPRISKANKTSFPQQHHPALHTSRHANHASRLPARDTSHQAPRASDAIILVSIAWRKNPYRQASHASILYWFCSNRIVVKHHRQMLHQFKLCSMSCSCFLLHVSSIFHRLQSFFALA